MKGTVSPSSNFSVFWNLEIRPRIHSILRVMNRLEKQIAFVMELDKLKRVVRRTYICGGERRENTAEHSWHTALIVLLLAEHSDLPIDSVRAIKMMLVHDIVEIDAGDSFIYDSAALASQEAREKAAADRIFSLLPEDQAGEMRGLWEEFEAQETPEARFAKAADRLIPMLHNYHSQGKSWNEHGVTRQMVLNVNSRIAAGSKVLWEYACRLVDSACDRGFLEI
jgi:putative hydrolase of HD superfamily